MFEITKDSFGSLNKVVLHHSAESALCGIIPDFGANPVELRLSCGNKLYSILEGFQAEDQLRSNEKSRGIHLLPFPNRIKDGTYFFKGKEYRLPVNKPAENNAIHGFIWNRKFGVIEQKCGQASALVRMEHHYTGDFPGYPFPFRAEYEYELFADHLRIKIMVTNTGKQTLPVGAGWHPYFTFHKKIDSVELKLANCSQLETDERLIPTGKMKPMSDFRQLETIGETSFDTAFQFTDSAEWFETQIKDPDQGIIIIIKQDKTFPFLQLYIPADRNSIAIEPMTCPANSFNSRSGLIELEPMDIYKGVIEVGLTNQIAQPE